MENMGSYRLLVMLRKRFAFFSFKNCATLHAKVYTPMIDRTSYQLQKKLHQQHKIKRHMVRK